MVRPMPDDFHALTLYEYAAQLVNPGERERVLRALDGAERLPIDAKTLDAIEKDYGDGNGLIDANAYIQEQLIANRALGEFEALMRAAAMVRVLVALKSVDTPNGLRFFRIDSLQ